MNRSFEKKKESGTAGRKRRSLEAKEKEKSSKVFKTFFQQPSTSTTSSDNPENSASARTQKLEDTGSSSSKKELVAASLDGDVENFSYNSKILATFEETEVGPEFDKEMKINDVEDKDLISENVHIIKCPIPKIIEEHDIGFLMFSEETGKAIITDPLRLEIIKHGFKHFQNIEGPFLPTNNRSMNKTWFFKKLGNGHGEQVMRSCMDPHRLLRDELEYELLIRGVANTSAETVNSMRNKFRDYLSKERFGELVMNENFLCECAGEIEICLKKINGLGLLLVPFLMLLDEV
ncbi:hypothetical protein RN001_016047 [Aquatica leii]|uniref:Uncharacterized protein n=1 Tax=Aquatica leii TaxID=1421715 RepID=A0AAN7QB18_9COLE|nr:hypothetical protein RN001_016047 [Aquatica leii]